MLAADDHNVLSNFPSCALVAVVIDHVLNLFVDTGANKSVVGVSQVFTGLF